MFSSILGEIGTAGSRVARIAIFLISLAALGGAQEHVPPKKPGVATAGIKIPLDKLTPEAKVELGGSPDWIAIDTDVWVSNMPKNLVSRIDRKTQTLKQTVEGFHKPCSGLAVGFGALWVPNCGDQTLARVDLENGRILETIKVTIADSEGGITVGAGSVWILTKEKNALARIDPKTSAIVATLEMPEGCYTPAFGFGSVWVSCTKQNSVVRVDPKINSIASTIAVGPKPRFLTVGEGAVWTLNQGDGTITRISAEDNKVAATIEVGIPGPGGDISAGEGSVWATSFGFPVSRIDPKTNAVVQQFVGPGGDAIRAGEGELWLSNYKSGVEWKLNPAKVAGIAP
jgi:virginiamycin B lyase